MVVSVQHASAVTPEVTQLIAPLAMMGIILGIMPSLDAHWWALQLCRLASRKLLVCAYSFDLPELTGALRYAASRGIRVDFYVDEEQTLRPSTWRSDMITCLNNLVESGIRVRLVSEFDHKQIPKPGAQRSFTS